MQKTIKREELKEGQIMITSVRAVKGDKFEVTFASKIARPEQAPSLAQMMNADDPKFSRKSDNVRFGWQAGTKGQIKELFGIDVTGVTEKPKEVNLLIEKEFDGYVLVMQVIDSTEPDDYAKDHVAERAKNTGGDAPLYFLYNRQFIFSKSKLILVPKGTKVEHTILSTKESGVFKPNCALLPFAKACDYRDGVDVTATVTKAPAKDLVG